jgi:4'-phosphopantetheinyl transferase EntD
MAIESAFEGLANRLVLVTGIDDVPGELTVDEQPAVARAVGKRRREFAAGRQLARHGLRSLGMEAVSIPMSERRYPLWPEGVVGSISHTGERVGVALARRRDYAAVGLDLEVRRSVTPNLFDSIMLDSERRRLPTASREEEATLIFSCKEAVFKAVYPVCGEFLDFLDVSIELLDGEFIARCRDSLRSAEMIGAARGYFEVAGEIVKSVFLVETRL